MRHWRCLLNLVICSTAFSTDRGVNHQDVAVQVTVGEPWRKVINKPEFEGLSHEIIARREDPTDSLVCRLVKMKPPQRVILVSPTAGLREFVLTPALYASLCVTPEKPRPFPLLFSPPPPLVTSPPSFDVVSHPSPPDSKGLASVTVPPTALSAPAPTISLVFSSPVGSVGIGSESSPAVNIGTQSITDSPEPPTWLVKGVLMYRR